MRLRLKLIPIATILFVLILLFNMPPSHSLGITLLSEKELASFRVIQEHIHHTGTDACIQKLTDGTRLYILKQINDPSLDEQFLLINDCIASTIGYNAGVAVNQVSFIPYNVGAHLKIYPERAATLHSIIPGQDLEKELPSNLLPDFSLQQRIINPCSSWQKKFPLAPQQQGLTRIIIESMSVNSMLCAITALDTFIGNSDRSLPNIFYDKKDRCFYGIDQAAAFSKPLSALACDRLDALIKEGYFTNVDRTIVRGLTHYYKVLKNLHETVKPTMIIQTMTTLSSYLALHAEQESQVKDRLVFHATVVEDNYKVTHNLLHILESIVLI